MIRSRAADPRCHVAAADARPRRSLRGADRRSAARRAAESSRAERPAHARPRSRAPDCRSPLLPDAAGTAIGASSSRAARVRIARDAASSPPPVTRTSLASAPEPRTITPPRPGTGRQISPPCATNAATSGCRAQRRARSSVWRSRISRLTRSRAARAFSSAFRRSLRAPRAPSSSVAPAISGPRAASHSDSIEPVTSHSATAPSTGTTDASSGTVGREGGFHGGGSSRGSARGSNAGRSPLGVARGAGAKAECTVPAKPQPVARGPRPHRPVDGGARAQAGEESPTATASRARSASERTATSSTMIVMLSRPPFSSAASIIAAIASAGSAFATRKCWMP